MQSVMDYCGQVWTPHVDKGDLLMMESPLRSYTKSFAGFGGLNYWSRLKKAGIQSVQRRNERFKILYLYKSLIGLVPLIQMEIKYDERKGRLFKLPKRTGNVVRIKTLKDKSLPYVGAKLFNALPASIRNLNLDFLNFKFIFDCFLGCILDEPVITGYNCTNLDASSHPSNSIIDWIRNLSLDEWTIDEYNLNNTDCDSIDY